MIFDGYPIYLPFVSSAAAVTTAKAIVEEEEVLDCIVYWGCVNNKHETLFENSHTYMLQN